MRFRLPSSGRMSRATGVLCGLWDGHPRPSCRRAGRRRHGCGAKPCPEPDRPDTGNSRIDVAFQLLPPTAPVLSQAGEEGASAQAGPRDRPP
ncbi:hypothetical protein FMEAI12_5130007 [Parafrankia sp. Ea1.12]|nr:hypothetical protein FMEAI12_5130007 [Parafrankia sp. Ea1.12]